MSVGHSSSITAHPFFTEGNVAEIRPLLDAAEELKFAAGEVIFEAGSEPDSLYLVAQGDVDFLAPYGSDEHRTVSSATAGEYFGEIGVLTGRPRSLRAIARNDVIVARIPEKALSAYLKNIPGPVEKLMFSLVRHLHDTTDHYLEDMVRQEKMALVGTMVNTILHDFKNPFCIISMGAQMLAQRHHDEQTLKLCRTMEEQVQRMFDMATELSEFSRGAHRFDFRRFDLREFVDRFRELNSPFFEWPGVVVDVDVPDMMIEGEPQRLMRVLQNLVGNALEALPDGKGRVSIKGRTEDDKLILQVSDTGHGIPPEIVARFWEPFVTHGKRNGTGLGSAIVKSIVEAHHGTVTFESKQNVGTTFTITLPIKQG